MSDAVDAIRDLWRTERPDLDTWPHGHRGPGAAAEPDP